MRLSECGTPKLIGIGSTPGLKPLGGLIAGRGGPQSRQTDDPVANQGAPNALASLPLSAA